MRNPTPSSLPWTSLMRLIVPVWIVGFAAVVVMAWMKSDVAAAIPALLPVAIAGISAVCAALLAYEAAGVKTSQDRELHTVQRAEAKENLRLKAEHVARMLHANLEYLRKDLLAETGPTKGGAVRVRTIAFPKQSLMPVQINVIGRFAIGIPDQLKSIWDTLGVFDPPVIDAFRSLTAALLHINTYVNSPERTTISVLDDDAIAMRNVEAFQPDPLIAWYDEAIRQAQTIIYHLTGADQLAPTPD